MEYLYVPKQVANYHGAIATTFRSQNTYLLEHRPGRLYKTRETKVSHVMTKEGNGEGCQRKTTITSTVRPKGKTKRKDQKTALRGRENRGVPNHLIIN